MLCPQCRVEYRPGYTHCTDCDVELIHGNAEKSYLYPRRAALASKWAEVLWQGTDVHFYIFLFFTLKDLDCPGFGRPVNSPVCASFQEQPAGGYSPVEFELRVSEERFPVARWVLKSFEELQAREQADTQDTQPRELDVSPEVVGVCALCMAEFTTSCSLCPNCGVPLRPPQRGALDHNPAQVLCSLPHPQFLADLRAGLQQMGIPFNNANFPEGPDSRRLDVRVLESDFERATEVLAQVLQYWEFDGSMGLGLGHDPLASYWPTRAKDKQWFPEDLDWEAWNGSNILVLNTLGMALREREIAYRVQSPEPGSARVFIHVEDEDAAREVLRDVVREGMAPE
jgi:hypothetical protein